MFIKNRYILGAVRKRFEKYAMTDRPYDRQHVTELKL
jgi:hypothetical protein